MRASWLRERGLDDSYYTTFRKPDRDSQGLREIGRWSYGPSYDVDGRVTPTETLVALARGSGVSLLRFSRADSMQLELLADINAPGLLNRVWVRDTLLYVGSAAGLEIWNIANERNPSRLSWIQTALNDFDVQDSLAYVIGADDSFKVYNVADPQNPVLRGACRDSGYLLSVTGNTAFLADRWGLYVVDITNPAGPHRIGAWGSAIEGVRARGSLCYVTTFNPNQPGDITFRVLDVTTPANPVQIGSVDSAGGYDLHLIDTLAFCSGDQYDEFRIVAVADSTHPRLVGTGNAPGANWGVWANAIGRAAFVAGRSEGLSVFDVANPAAPIRDTVVLAMDQAEDVSVQGGLAAIAEYVSGLVLLNVQDPSKPAYLGRYDTLGDLPYMESAVLADSFAYVSWPVERLQSVDISDPTHPVRAGVCQGMFGPPQDMVLRDSFVYNAEGRRLQIVNVARPRQPVRVGSCVAGDATSPGICLVDTLAYVTNVPTQVINVANPASPQVVGEFGRSAWNIRVRDTFAYLACGTLGLYVFSVSNPQAPYRIDSLSFGESVYDLVLADSFVYAGCDDGVRLMSLADPVHPTVVGFLATPYLVWRMTYASPYVYAACSEAGVCILETLPVGIAEPDLPGTPPASSNTYLKPSLVRGFAWVRQRQGSLAVPVVYDHAGREQVMPHGCEMREGRWTKLDMRGLPTGVYFVRFLGDAATEVVKIVKL
jgi:hypothetical protein